MNDCDESGVRDIDNQMITVTIPMTFAQQGVIIVITTNDIYPQRNTGNISQIGKWLSK